VTSMSSRSFSLFSFFFANRIERGRDRGKEAGFRRGVFLPFFFPQARHGKEGVERFIKRPCLCGFFLFSPLLFSS